MLSSSIIQYEQKSVSPPSHKGTDTRMLGWNKTKLRVDYYDKRSRLSLSAACLRALPIAPCWHVVSTHKEPGGVLKTQKSVPNYVSNCMHTVINLSFYLSSHPKQNRTTKLFGHSHRHTETPWISALVSRRKGWKQDGSCTPATAALVKVKGTSCMRCFQ